MEECRSRALPVETPGLRELFPDSDIHSVDEDEDFSIDSPYMAIRPVAIPIPPRYPIDVSPSPLYMTLRSRFYPTTPPFTSPVDPNDIAFPSSERPPSPPHHPASLIPPINTLDVPGRKRGAEDQPESGQRTKQAKKGAASGWDQGSGGGYQR